MPKDSQNIDGLAVDVALKAPLWQPYTYKVPEELAGMIKPLTRLVAPLRKRKVLGFALCEPYPSETARLKPVHDVLDEAGSPAWPPLMLGFFQRAAAHYQLPLGQALAYSLPAGLGSVSGQSVRALKKQQVMLVSFRKGPMETRPKTESQAGRMLRRLERAGRLSIPDLKPEFPRATSLARDLEAKGHAAIHHIPLVRDLLGRAFLPEPKPDNLTPEQESAMESISQALSQGGFHPFLIHGVTGSGKTELYLAACEQALAKGRQALILCPEIGICLRLEGLLRSRFGAEKVAVLHSGISPAARRGQWMAISRGEARLVVGARSAVFAPLDDLAVICVDEEQDEAYKQEDRLRYNARDLALLRGQEQGATVILGTATPAVTTWHRAAKKELSLLRMTKRVKKACLPKMEIVDLRKAGSLRQGFLSHRLHMELKQTVERGEQAILFLNRRGFAPALICETCGKTIGCPACSVSLTWHQNAKSLICHTCGHQQPEPRCCPSCGAPAEKLKPLGLGTEGVAKKLAELEPGFRLARLDRDTANHPKKLGELLGRIAHHEVDVVVGTQMITKGHHFPRISLVGVLLADLALSIPDFRAAERAHTLLTQVAGRAGREGGRGLVLVQTYDPENQALLAAVHNEQERFYLDELEQRQALSYPPFSRLVSIRVEALQEQAAWRAASDLSERLGVMSRKLNSTARILGPAPAPIQRAAGKFRFLILIKAPGSAGARRLMSLTLSDHPAPRGVRYLVDVDPLTIM